MPTCGGLVQPLTFEPRVVLAYLRQTSDQTVLVALNFSRPRAMFLSRMLSSGHWRLLLSNRRQELTEPTGTGLLCSQKRLFVVAE